MSKKMTWRGFIPLAIFLLVFFIGVKAFSVFLTSMIGEPAPIVFQEKKVEQHSQPHHTAEGRYLFRHLSMPNEVPPYGGMMIRAIEATQ